MAAAPGWTSLHNGLYHPDGTFDKCSCRIVFRGDRWYGLYCNKTYAGCVMSESVRLLLSVAVAEDMELASVDVKTAYNHLTSGIPGESAGNIRYY